MEWSHICYGLLGGGLAELAGVYQFRKDPSCPDWMLSKRYWFLSALMMLAGGVLVHLYCESDVGMTPILATNLGASAPLLLQSFTKAVPRPNVPDGDVD